MKKILCMFLCVPFLFSCNKDDDNEPNDNAKRLKEVIITQQSSEDSIKLVFNYRVNDLVSVNTLAKSYGNQTWETISLDQISYIENLVSVVSYENTQPEMTPVYRQDLLVEEGLVTQFSEFDYTSNIWYQNSKTEIEYLQGLIDTWKLYYDIEGTGALKLYETGTYNYTDGNVKKLEVKDNYVSNQLCYYEDFNYNNNLLSECKSFIKNDGDWIGFTKIVYQYNTNEQISGIVHLTYNEEWIPDSYVNFHYDADGKLVEEAYDDGTVYTYVYEDGSGNADFFWVSPIEEVYNFPVIRDPVNKKLTGIHYFMNKTIQQ